MKPRTRRRNRGSLMLGLAGLTFALAMFCGAVLARSLDAYHSSARLEQRLRAQAAAEGALVALQANPAVNLEPLMMGGVRVKFEPQSTGSEGVSISLRVEVLSPEGRTAAAFRYVASRAGGESGDWTLDGPEPVS